VAVVDVQVRAVAAGPEARPRRVQRLVLGEDLDPPVRRVAHDLAAARRDDDRLAHQPESMEDGITGTRNRMPAVTRRLTILLAAAALAGGLPACGTDDAAKRDAEEAAKDADREAGKADEKAGEAAEDAADEVEKGVEDVDGQ
jgi:hypothetical protein